MNQIIRLIVMACSLGCFLCAQDLTLFAAINVSRSGAQGSTYAIMPYGWIQSSTASLLRNGANVAYVDGQAAYYGYSVNLSVSDNTNPPANTLYELYAEAEGEIADYGYFIRSEYAYGVTPPPSVSVSGSSVVIDGYNGYFSMSSDGGSPVGYEWLYSAPQGAGNDPSVLFFNLGSSTVTDAHWFALPDVPCSASGATYTVRGCGLIDGQWYEGWAPYTVETLEVAGTTANPIVSGSVTITETSPGTFRVTGNGLGRTQPQVTINVPPSSQFYDKVRRHEDVHVDQFQNSLFGSYWSPADAYSLVNNLTGTSRAALLARVNNVVVAYNQGQDAAALYIMMTTGEDLAYAVSDSIPPFYRYQGACRRR